MATHTCPNCGAKLETRIIITLAGNRQRNGRTKTFEQSVPFVPTGRISSFIWRLVLNRPLHVQKSPHIEVRSVIKTTPTQTLINQLEIPATEHDIQQLAGLYCNPPGGLGLNWARGTTTARLNFSQTKHNRIADSFIQLRFLEVSRGTADNPKGYDLTDAGKRFLRHYLPQNTGVYNEKLHHVNKQ